MVGYCEIMDKEDHKIRDIRDLLFDDASLLITDEDIALHCMHRFNIDRETVETLPAFDEPLKTLFWPDRK